LQRSLQHVLGHEGDCRARAVVRVGATVRDGSTSVDATVASANSSVATTSTVAAARSANSAVGSSDTSGANIAIASEQKQQLNISATNTGPPTQIALPNPRCERY